MNSHNEWHKVAKEWDKKESYSGQHLSQISPCLWEMRDAVYYNTQYNYIYMWCEQYEATAPHMCEDLSVKLQKTNGRELLKENIEETSAYTCMHIHKSTCTRTCARVLTTYSDVQCICKCTYVRISHTQC